MNTAGVMAAVATVVVRTLVNKVIFKAPLEAGAKHGSLFLAALPLGMLTVSGALYWMYNKWKSRNGGKLPKRKMMIARRKRKPVTASWMNRRFRRSWSKCKDDLARQMMSSCEATSAGSSSSSGSYKSATNTPSCVSLTSSVSTTSRSFNQCKLNDRGCGGSSSDFRDDCISDDQNHDIGVNTPSVYSAGTSMEDLVNSCKSERKIPPSYEYGDCDRQKQPKVTMPHVPPSKRQVTRKTRNKTYSFLI